MPLLRFDGVIRGTVQPRHHGRRRAPGHLLDHVSLNVPYLLIVRKRSWLINALHLDELKAVIFDSQVE